MKNGIVPHRVNPVTEARPVGSALPQSPFFDPCGRFVIGPAGNQSAAPIWLRLRGSLLLQLQFFSVRDFCGVDPLVCPLVCARPPGRAVEAFVIGGRSRPGGRLQTRASALQTPDSVGQDAILGRHPARTCELSASTSVCPVAMLVPRVTRRRQPAPAGCSDSPGKSWSDRTAPSPLPDARSCRDSSPSRDRRLPPS